LTDLQNLPLSRLPEEAESQLSQSLMNLPWVAQAVAWQEDAGYARERDGVFVSEDQLLVNLPGPDEQKLAANIKALEAFLDKHNRRAYLTLIPTACAIRQQDVPAYAPLYNQRQFISNIYNTFSGRMISIDAYSALFANKDQYIYYRTESNITSLGGYYLYYAMGTRMGFSARTLDQFEAEHIRKSFRGDIYRQVPFERVIPDIMTVYHFSRYDRQYMISHRTREVQKQYYTLFPPQTQVLGDYSSVVMGGMSPVTDIEIFSPYARSLLVFGDRTALGYIPFLTVHYQRITVVDLSRADQDYLAGLDVSDYDQVLFCYSVDTLMHTTDLSSVALVG
jgi:hypothetical protein